MKKPVRITWIDSATVGSGGWVDRNDIGTDCMSNEGLTQISVGWVIEESDDVLLIAQTTGGLMLGGVLAIPKLSILERKKLK